MRGPKREESAVPVGFSCRVLSLAVGLKGFSCIHLPVCARMRITWNHGKTLQTLQTLQEFGIFEPAKTGCRVWNPTGNPTAASISARRSA